MSRDHGMMYSSYERVWHWAQAAGIAMLLITGLCIHWPEVFFRVSFAWAIRVHNVLGFLLVINAFLGLFYYVTTGAIRQLIPGRHDLGVSLRRQAAYYLRGIFRGEPHPVAKTPDRRLNSMQQVTYLGILNVLLPFQAATGLLMWAAPIAPEAVSAVGGIPGLALLHTAGAWLFAAFLAGHLYLITTGHTPASNLKAMVVGYEQMESRDE